MAKEKVVRIGCYSGFWGDSTHAARQLVDKEKSNLDYLVADYLAEVTMGLLARRSRGSKEPSKARPGYIEEIIPLVLEDLLPKLVQYNIKLICNAGALDPAGLKLAIEKLAEKQGSSDKVVVAAIFGDDIHPVIDTVRDAYGAISPFSPFGDTGGSRVEESGSEGSKSFLSVNAYVGAQGIAQALDGGATIVVTGRCVDSALTLGPCLHEYKWNILSDFNLLAAGSLAGHIIECGAQATGGNFTDWREAAFSKNGGWANMGYGIVEMSSDGTFVVTKPPNTGGVVSVNSVGEQMLYEVLDPAHYLLPDVILDLTQVTLTQLAPERVLVRGARGLPPTEWLKCTAIGIEGFSILGQLGIVGVDAREKALVLGQALLDRVGQVLKERKLPPFSETRVEAIGSEHMFGKHAASSKSREVILRVQAAHSSPLPLRLLAMEFAYSGTSTSPAITGGGTGRPNPSPRFSTTSFLLHKSQLPLQIVIGDTEPVSFYHPLKHCRAFVAPKPTSTRTSLLGVQLPSVSSVFPSTSPRSLSTTLPAPASTRRVPLIEIAVGRSGDKGDTANIAFIARQPKHYNIIKEQVTEDVVRDTLEHLLTDKSIIQRYDVDGVRAVNFVVSNCLGGGGLKSIRFDKQAKSYAQICLSAIEVDIPVEIPSSKL